MSNVKTFQYSVKENIRPVSECGRKAKAARYLIFFFQKFISDHDKGSHGIAGLYFKYDMSALMVIVEQDQENIVNFIVRLSAVIAGIIVISG